MSAIHEPKDKSDRWWSIHLNFCEQCRRSEGGKAYLERQRKLRSETPPTRKAPTNDLQTDRPRHRVGHHPSQRVGPMTELALAALVGFAVGVAAMAGYGYSVAFLTLIEEEKRQPRGGGR